jgi:DNA polymerase-3 subunit gamma/tau
MINERGDENIDNEDFAFNIFELDAASNNSVDDIRNLTDQVRIPPQVGKYKVILLMRYICYLNRLLMRFLKP